MQKRNYNRFGYTNNFLILHWTVALLEKEVSKYICIILLMFSGKFNSGHVN